MSSPRLPHSGPDPVPDLDPWLRCIARVATRDEDALRELYDGFGPRVLGIARQILHDSSAEEDVVVEVFSQAWREADRYDAARGSVATWIGTMARARAIDMRRRLQRHSRRELALVADDAHEMLDPANSPWLVASDADRATVVRSALDRLPREQRRAVEAAFFGGLSHSEIAAALNAPLGTVKTRIRSALSSLRSALGSIGGELA